MIPAYIRAAPTVALLALLVAGCLSDPAAPARATVAYPPVDDGGTVAGVTVDETAAPLAGVRVAIGSLEGTAFTDEDGRFVFLNVPAGARFVSASKLGYEGASLPVTVSGAGSIDVQIVMAAVTYVEPRTDLVVYQGMIACGVGANAQTFTYACPTGEYRSDTQTSVTSDVVGLLEELVWSQATTTSTDQFRLVFGFNEQCVNAQCTFEHEYADLEGPSPLRAYADELPGVRDAPEGTSVPVFHRIWVPTPEPAGLAVMVNQGFTLYMTAFYGEAMPEGYTAVAG